MTGCVILAAGLGSRFGGDKLLAEYGGKPLIERALDAVPPGLPAAVVTGDARIAAAARARGFLVCENDRPEDGLSRSVRLGTEALGACEALLFLVADQPLLTREGVAAVLACAEAHPGCICAAASGGRRGNPCLFPRSLFPELCALRGDVGGSAVIRCHEDLLRLCELPAPALRDIDTKDALRALTEKPE